MKRKGNRAWVVEEKREKRVWYGEYWYQTEAQAMEKLDRSRLEEGAGGRKFRIRQWARIGGKR